LNPEAALTLRGRVAWAHDRVSDPSLAPVFQALPGASFVVNGATPAKNSALTSAGAELRLANGVALLAKFDGEFAAHSTTYAGTGKVRYTGWVRPRAASLPSPALSALTRVHSPSTTGVNALNGYGGEMVSLLRPNPVSHVRVAPFIVNNRPETMDQSRRSVPATAGSSRARPTPLSSRPAPPQP